MDHNHMLILILGLTSSTILIILFFTIIFFYQKGKRSAENESTETISSDCKESDDDEATEDLIRFEEGENLTTYDILDAPGEVIGKSSYGTMYKAALQQSNAVALLRFLRPACSVGMKEVFSVIHLLGFVRHANLVPLLAFYAGPRGEKLLVHPFYNRGTLAQFIRDGNGESHKWAIIYRIAIGIAKGLDHLHTGLQKPVIHGNLKSKNILLDRNYHPYISDFGLHLLLNPTAGQAMLEASAAQGYKAPELIKMKDANQETDIYSLGVIFLEILTGKEPINENPSLAQEFYLPNSMRNAVLDNRIAELYHPDILLGQSSNQSQVTEELILKFFQLAMACCSPSPSLRPDIEQVLRKLKEIGK